MRHACRLVVAAALAAGGLGSVRAGPPFLTDDPDPVDLGHWEFYVFGQGDRNVDGDTIAAPAVEVNYGVAPNTQLHLIAPLTTFSAPAAGAASGYGDTEVGIKYRFLAETDTLPEIGVFPLAELATGQASRGLGNGRTWYRLPVWVQKSWGPWTVDGGGGVALNSAPGQRDYGFGGLLVQRDLGKYFTPGIELFSQGADTITDRAFTVANAGGTVKINDNFDLLLSGGRSISGARQVVWYLALYWTWGPPSPGK